MYHFIKGTTCEQAHVNIPEGTYEEEFGREGFMGAATHLYHVNCPTGWTRIEGPLKPRAFDCNKLTGAIDKTSNRTPVLYNDDLVIAISKPTEPMDFYFRNGDGDELYFIHQGAGTIETDFGPLTFKKGDYIVIPRGTTYRFLPDGPENFFLITESRGSYRQPDRGMLGHHALYDPALINVPEPQEKAIEKRDEWEVRIKRAGELTSVFYPFCPIEMRGWKGDLTVWSLNVNDICPVMSHRAHLPPSVHTTFVNDKFVVCSFVPRPLESEPGAERVPFYHRNIDYDEILFYHEGNFFSREGIDTGMITFHPQGIHHGPHPGAIEGAKNLDRTDEIAVMIDTRHPLKMTPEAHATEWKNYYMSWQSEALST